MAHPKDRPWQINSGTGKNRCEEEEEEGGWREFFMEFLDSLSPIHSPTIKKEQQAAEEKLMCVCQSADPTIRCWGSGRSACVFFSILALKCDKLLHIYYFVNLKKNESIAPMRKRKEKKAGVFIRLKKNFFFLEVANGPMLLA